MLRFWWILSQLSSRMWFSTSLYGVVAMLTPLVAVAVDHFIPTQMPTKIGADAVDSILNVLAMSMLSVTIFSLSTMVAAYSAATSNVTPRATLLLIQDKISHRALSTFLGSFIFSIVSIAALKSGVYGESGRFVLYLMTMGVLAMIIITLLRWIEYLARLGRVGETIDRVETITLDALKKRLSSPYLGGVCLRGEIPQNAEPVAATEIGYVQYIDMGRLENIAVKHRATIYLSAQPGKFLDGSTILAYITRAKVDEALTTEMNRAFIVDGERSFPQDPRFGFTVMQEIAVRALSPAVNDPGTAIHIITAAVRVLTLLGQQKSLAAEHAEPQYPHVYVAPLTPAQVFEDIFPAIARDGSSNLQVHIWLQKAYAALSKLDCDGIKKVAKEHAEQSLKRAEKGLALKEDIDVLKALKKQNFK